TTNVDAVQIRTSQMNNRLRTDDRVTVMERTNFKSTEKYSFEPAPAVFTIDVSFTSIVPILRHIVTLFSHKYTVIALIKPQFESYLEERESDGILTSLETHEKVVMRVLDECTALGLYSWALDRCPIRGSKGNIEYRPHLEHGRHAQNTLDEKDIQPIIHG